MSTENKVQAQNASTQPDSKYEAKQIAQISAMAGGNGQNVSYSIRIDSLQDIWWFADVASKTEFVPKEMRGNQASSFIAIQFGLELGLSPMQALQNIAVINGRPTIWGDAMIAIVLAHPECEGVDEEILELGDNNLTAKCTVKRKKRSPVTRFFTQADAIKAGLWTKKGPWQTYPKRMLQMRARSWALRDSFADALRGLMAREEAMDIPTNEPAQQGTKTVQYVPKPEKMQAEHVGTHALYQTANDATVTQSEDKPSVEEIQQLERDFERLDENSKYAFSDWLKKHNASSISELTNGRFKKARLAVDRKLNDAEINRKAAIKKLLAKADKAKISHDFLSKLAAEWFNDTPLQELTESDVNWFLENWDAKVQPNWNECKPISKKQARELRQACEQAGLFESVLIENISRQMMIAKLDDLPVSLYQQVLDSIPQIVERQAIEYQKAKGY